MQNGREGPLYPEGTPGLERFTPTLTYYLPDEGKRTGTAVIVCPGGGYGHLATGHEGHDVCRWLNSFGVAGVMLKYRNNKNNYRHPAPLHDAQRAIRTVRSRAKELRLRPDRIGILGFSAGGHLTSSAGTHFDAGDPNAADPVEQISCRPDFMVLIYPVIALGESFTHKGSQRNLLGPDPDPELVRSMSSEKQVTPRTPPTFLVHGSEDTAVPPENSIIFYRALHRVRVPVELHLFAKGGHGIGLRRDNLPWNTWPDLCRIWMQGNGWLDTESD